MNVIYITKIQRKKMNRRECRELMYDKINKLNICENTKILIKRFINDTIIISKQDTVSLIRFNIKIERCRSLLEEMKDLKREKSDYKVCLDMLKREL